MSFSFKIHAQSSKSHARRGTLSTPHGDIQTPAFVTVGTKATVKSLAPADLDLTKTQFIFGNTYHLVLSPGVDIIQQHGGIHKMSGINKPFITDSGGFQVFSLASSERKIKHEDSELGPTQVKITPDGVEFRAHSNGTKYFFTPEFSIEAQQKIGADFMVAMDECIYYEANHAYTLKGTERTHEWALRSINQAKSTDKTQKLYGVVQGGRFEDLRHFSASEIAKMPFFGIALGGVAVGGTSEELQNEVIWMMEALHTDPRPRHLLGISTFDHVLFAVKHGLDTFDCILPARDARTGRLYVRTGEENGIGIYDKINIMNAKWTSSIDPISEKTLGSVTYAYLQHLFKQRELLAYRLATIHNLSLTEQYFAEIRTAIENGRL